MDQELLISPDGDIFATGITTVGILTVTGRVKIGGDLDVAGDITYDEITGRNLNITGVSTLTSTLQVGSGVTVSPDGDVFATGVTTSTTFVGNLTGNVTGNVTGTADKFLQLLLFLMNHQIQLVSLPLQLQQQVIKHYKQEQILHLTQIQVILHLQVQRLVIM